MTTPNLGLDEVPSNSLQPSVPINADLQALDALVQAAVEGMLNDPPATVSVDVGKRWIIGAAPTGAWAGKAGQVALCTAAGLWRYFVPAEGWSFRDRDTGLLQVFDGAAWSAHATIAAGTPAAAAAAGTAGTVLWDANYVYVCTAADTWKRAALVTW